MTDEATSAAVDDTDLSSGAADDAETLILDEGDNLDADDDADNADDGAGDGDQPTEEDLAEIDYEGSKFKVPAVLKDAFLRTADYTRKTMDLAEQRKAWEQERTQQAEAFEATFAERAQLKSIDDRLEQFKQVDWPALRRQDRDTHDDLKDQQAALKEARTELAGTIGQKEQEAALEAQRTHAKRIQEGLAVLTRDIPGFSLELVGKLTDHVAKTFGFTREEVSAIDDPRIIKVMHRLYELDGKAKQEKRTQAVQQTQRTQPARTLRGANGKFSADAATNDFAAFEKMADAKLK